MKNMRSVLAKMESKRRGGEVGIMGREQGPKGSRARRGTLSSFGRSEQRKGGGSVAGEEASRESRSSAMDGKGLLANGGMGWSGVEKSKGAGYDWGLSSNQTSLYIWISRLRRGLAVGVLSWFM
jgi:hypothetical protein